MAISVCEVSLTEAPLVLPEPNDDPQAGAVVVFWGAVRAIEEGREITGIEYEAHRAMAEHQMRLVAEAAAEEFRRPGNLASAIASGLFRRPNPLWWCGWPADIAAQPSVPANGSWMS